jgi:hypothetical protein
VEIRAAQDADFGAVVAVCTAALGWDAKDPNEEWFWWKHKRNPFGASPIWVAVDDGAIVAVRAFMRWGFARGDRSVSVVRAVDTATLPSHQRQGLFSTLTLHGLGELEAEGVDFVFNTPNDQSRAGYLLMGWREVGPVPIAVRPGGLRSLGRTMRARVPAAKWSLPCDVGEAVTELVAGHPGETADLLAAAAGPGDAWRTARSTEYLAWRYGFAPLRYRALTLGTVADGLVVFRLRTRGPAIECVVCEVLVPGPDPRRGARLLLKRLRREVRADHLIVSAAVVSGLEWIPAGRLGPVVTVRDAATPAPSSIADFELALGDVELF